MQLTKPDLQQFFQLVDWTFRNAVAETSTFWKYFAMKTPSRTEKNVYPWIAETPAIREWLGERVVNNIRTRDYTLNKLADDTYGFFDGYTAALGKRVAEFPDVQLSAQLEAGGTTKCWDGQNEFDTAHPVDVDDTSKGTFSNNLVGATYDLSTDPVGVYAKVRAAMMKVKRDDGLPLGLVGNVLMVPPDWEVYGLKAVQAQIVMDLAKASGTVVGGAGVTNVFQGTSTLIVNPWLTKADAGYLFCTTKGILPLLYQDREGPNFVPRVDPASNNVFLQRRFEWGVDLRAAFGYTLPYLAFRFAAT
jgi:phage major head subunit gpT-like protein